MKITYQKDGNSHIVSAELSESFSNSFLKKLCVMKKERTTKADAIQQVADLLNALKDDIDEMILEVKDL